MGFVKCTIIIVVVCIIIWVLSKWLNFSIIPKGFIIPKANPQTFKLPKLTRKENGELVVESDDDSSLEYESSSSNDESDDDDSSDESSSDYDEVTDDSSDEDFY